MNQTTQMTPKKEISKYYNEWRNNPQALAAFKLHLMREYNVELAELELLFLEVVRLREDPIYKGIK